MTVTYTSEVATSSFACFLKLLFRWKGSVYKLIWKEFLIFAGLYFGLSALYRFGLDADQKRIFEKIVWWCETYNNLIPVAFVLGFYVTMVVGRWWSQFTTIPWPDNVALKLTAHLQGHDERARLMRRTIMRYVCLAFVITLSSISSPVKKRFPTFRHMTEAGFMTENEQAIMEKLPSKYNKFWVPLVWSTALVTRARRENKIKDDIAVKTLIDEIGDFRFKLARLFNYDWITVPLVYTQVVTLAVHIFIASCLMGRQFVEGDKARTADMYFPLFTFLQFFFYLGWLKVAETMVNPFGEDDDDFNTNFLIDRNMQLTYLIVDEMHQEHPELIRDQYWDTVEFSLPYTEAAQQFCVKDPILGSAMNLHLEPEKKEFVHLSTLEEEVSQVVIGQGHHDHGVMIASKPGIERRASHSPPRRDSYLPRLSLLSPHHGSARSIGTRLRRSSSRDEKALHGEPPSPQTEADFPLMRDEDIFHMSNSTLASHGGEEKAGEERGRNGDDVGVDANKKGAPIDPLLSPIAEDENSQFLAGGQSVKQ